MNDKQSDDTTNVGIVRELLLEVNPQISDETVIRIWDLCNGNPWCAKVTYNIVQLMEQS
jgi:hypothetical protein